MRTTCNTYLKIIPRSEWLVSVVFGVMATILIAAQAAPSQIVITPASTWPMLAGNTQAVNNGPGNQVNPRVNCNVVSYTFDDLEGSSTIHYFDLTTGIDSTAPGNTLDRLSEINGSRLAFTELTGDGDHIVVYDTVTNTIAVVPGFHRFFPRIGGNTLAFWQGYYASQTEQEIGVYDLTTGAVTMLTNDAPIDQFPAVSPSGDVVVWKKCEADGTSCHVYSAVRSSTGVFTTQALTGGTGSEDFPQTDGNIVSYISNRSGDDDIYYQPVGGGTETRISLPGIQREPTISGNLLAFESNQTGEYEVFIYDMNSGILYQVTTSTTPWGSLKTLNHISVCNGTGRVVYATPGNGAFDVYAFTFQPPDPPNGRITDLIALVNSYGLPTGIRTSLVVKLQDAIAAMNTGDTATACMALADFVNEVNAQSGKKLTVQQAQQLLQSATTIRSMIGCA